jgi:DNA-binding response OmpR family regulator
MQILLLEDSTGLASGLRRILRGEGDDVDWVGTAADAEACLAADAYHLLIVDSSSLEAKSMELLKGLRSSGSPLACIVIYKEDGPYGRIDWLEAGADFAFRAPINLPELRARIMTVRRRTGGGK